MHSKPQKRTAARLTCKESWKSCLPAKTKARARMPPPFLQPSCVLRSRFEAVLKRSEKVKLHAGNQRQDVVITGASSGIGEATAVMLAQRGARSYSGRAAFGGELIPTASTLLQNSFIQ